MQQAQQLLIVLEVWWSTDSYFVIVLLALAVMETVGDIRVVGQGIFDALMIRL
ncbi:MAG: hypothetical protein WAZ77_12415 [Candidatus Nitrosopolaris sp.]